MDVTAAKYVLRVNDSVQLSWELQDPRPVPREPEPGTGRCFTCGLPYWIEELPGDSSIIMCDCGVAGSIP